LTLSKAGKPMGKIYNPNSEKAKAGAAEYKAKTSGASDLPF
jgi:hypothetical protein